MRLTTVLAPSRVVLPLPLILFLSACEQGVVVGTQCDLTSDCRSPLVCRQERCRTECRTHRDCGPGQLCLLFQGEAGSCRLEEEVECAPERNDCPGALRCIDYACTNECDSHADCGGEGALCVGGGCVAPPVETDAGQGPDDDGRVIDGLLLRYDFDEGSGDRIRDHSGRADPDLDLIVQNPNAIDWVSDGHGLSVHTAEPPVERTVITSARAGTFIADRVVASGEFTVELWVTPHSPSPIADTPGRMVSLEHDPDTTNFLIGHGSLNESPRWHFRVVTDGANTLYRNMSPVDPFTSLTQLVLTLTPDRICRARDGTMIDCDSTEGGSTVLGWGNFEFGIANLPTGDRPFAGTFHLVAVYERALDAHEILRNYLAPPSTR